jgi:predicted transcriptional regulator
MPNTVKKHAASFYLSRDMTSRIESLAESLDISKSAIVAMCINAALPTIDQMQTTINAESKERLCRK